MICDSCGYRKQEGVKSCRGCGVTLDSKMRGEEISSMLNRLSDRSDILTPSTLDIAMTWVFFAAAIAIFVVTLVFSKHFGYALLFAGVSVLGGVNAGHPKVIWELEKFRLSFKANGTDDLTPSDFWKIGRKISYWVIFALVIAAFAAAFTDAMDSSPDP
ncbi:MAG: hypothetical protein LBI19_10010, partial [Oscillospiraceae bacterium]|nr:hypothetical protein [Oscillospiraceae bacterium]